MFRTVPLSIIRSFFFHCTHSNGICHTGLRTAWEQDQDGFRPDPARKVVCKVRMVPCNIRTAHTTYAGWCRATSAPHTRPTQQLFKTTTHPNTRCRKPYAATQHLTLLMMGVYTRNMSSYEYINKITLLHQADISNYFVRKMRGQTTLKLPYQFVFHHSP